MPLADLLGADGYRYCDGREPDVPAPACTPLTAEDFRDARVVFAFRANGEKTGWEVATMYVQPQFQEGAVMVERYWQDNPDAPFAGSEA